MTESRKFSVHPQIIYSLIQAQAGTLGKAVLESVMNSIDADATKITIDISRTKLKIVDDGHGFRSRKEIEDCFEVFGFPHEEGARIYGQFGIGRAQLWSFCSTVWRTNGFVMDVDIKNRGLDYHLKENQNKAQGLSIDAKFYTPLTTHDLMVFEKELKDLAMYAQIPVYLNGELISRDPTKEKWTHDTDDAWIKVSDSSYLTVYNLGVLVKRFYAGVLGVGGLVVTKPGVRLALNMARNDILEAECKVWARIKPFIQRKADEKVRTKTTKLTDAELENRAQRFLSEDLAFKEIKDTRLITDITNRSHTIEQFMNGRRGRIVTMALPESQRGQRAHMTKSAFVLHPITLVRFGAESLEEFKTKLIESMADMKDVYWFRNFVSQTIFEPDLAKAVPHLSDNYEVLSEKDVTVKEKALLWAFSFIDSDVRSLISNLEEHEEQLASREIRVGISDSADAWTDGVKCIVFNRKSLASADKGIGGMLRIISLLVHEYLHNGPSTDSHVHDETFYYRFHSAYVYSEELGDLAFKAYRLYVQRLRNKGITVSKTLLEPLTFAENLDNSVPSNDEGEPVEERLAA